MSLRAVRARTSWWSFTLKPGFWAALVKAFASAAPML
jgi:hypothetical protein